MEWKYKEELIANAKAIASPGKGILAADESTGTIGKRFKDINVENNEENRRNYRELLFSSPDIGKYISGVILYEETLYQNCANGKPFVDLLKEKGVIIGIKTDMGTKPIPFSPNEKYTQGLDNLDIRCKKYYQQGARFCKWRAVITISKTTPSEHAIQETAHTLASYAAISQMNGLVPIVEPEVLMDGDHDIEVCLDVTCRAIRACYAALGLAGVLLEGTLLKPNMVLPGASFAFRDQINKETIAKYTIACLKRTVPSAVPGINFLSGGLSEEEATVYLNEINKDKTLCWNVSFSYGRALQKSCLLSWKGSSDNVISAQAAFLTRAKANSLAQLGEYTGDAATELSNMKIY